MGRAPCCDKNNVKKGPWSPEEDAKLKAYIEQHGTGGNWIALPQKIGLKRCGKSCRLRWLNYLRPNIKHGGFSEEEDNIICSLYISIGSSPEPNGAEDGSSSQALSNSALERLQLHMQLQNLQNPLSFYNNPALWPKLHPFQEKLLLQSLSESPNNPLMQHLLPSTSQGNITQKVDLYEQLIGAVTHQQDYPKFDNSKVDGLENSMNNITPSAGGSVPFSNGNNVLDSTLVARAADVLGQSDAASQSVSNIQAEIEGLLNSKVSDFMEQENQIGEFDCFKEMNGSKDSLTWWSNDFEAKSASSANSWDSTSVLHQPEGMFQGYEELGYNL
ncbi:hypothetical protein Tsubulata_021251 [Turnera subulata]|uniref:Uncharacterized protein n=1 Tax=Turnera subulata TaxID=218843 RepID=A0A9Q0FAA3_9ROSI|nr:hypothetical protein Tsubulata_021251 [Turnera subulata]